MSALGKVVIGEKAPDFHCEAVIAGKVQDVTLSTFINEDNPQWLILLFIPAAFSFVCPTEVLAFQNCLDEFKDRGCAVAFVSVDTKHSLWHWQNVPQQYGGLGNISIPLLSDPSHKMSRDYGVLIESEGICLRGMFVLDNTAIVQQVTLNNLAVGRSVLEALRLLEAFQAVQKHGVLCPIDWKPSADTQATVNTISKTLSEAYDERLANLQAEFGGVQVVDLDAAYPHNQEKEQEIPTRAILRKDNESKTSDSYRSTHSSNTDGTIASRTSNTRNSSSPPDISATRNPPPAPNKRPHGGSARHSRSYTKGINHNWESRRGSHVVLEFSDPTANRQPATNSAGALQTNPTVKISS